MALWNPATREFKPLPQDFFEFTHSPPGEFDYVFGFGFDPLSQDYKVVCIWFLYDEEDTSNNRVWFAAVYSLAKDCWINLTCNFDPDPLMEKSAMCSTCVNGFYYWCVSSEKAVVIRYFDMHNEVFGEISGPDDISRWDYYDCDCDLTIYNEYICLLVCHDLLHDQGRYAEYPPIDVWLMDDEKLWTKVLNVVPTRAEIFNVVPAISECEPLGFWGSDDKFIFQCSRDIIFYDSKTLEFTRLLDAKEERCDCSTLSYKESLVSIQDKNVCHGPGDILNVIQEYFNTHWEDV